MSHHALSLVSWSEHFMCDTLELQPAFQPSQLTNRGRCPLIDEGAPLSPNMIAALPPNSCKDGNESVA